MTHKRIELPAQLQQGQPLILSVSGGKDSTAAALALREAGLSYRMVFADTQWEAPETYAHLDHLRTLLGPIDVVGLEGGLPGRVLRSGGFPSRMRRWCTADLKVKPLRQYHDAAGDDTVCVVGVRSSESVARSKMPEVEDDAEWGGWIWRPLITWTVADVLAIHHRHGVPVNPLYQRGHDRVGCYPCVFSTKEDVALMAKHAPDRVDQIRALETDIVTLRAERNAETPGRYKSPPGTFFMGKDSRAGRMPIDTVVEWARTSHGGRQLPLLADPPAGGCFRWGLCEPPPAAPAVDLDLTTVTGHPCPSCGGIDTVSERYFDADVGDHVLGVTACNTCGAS